MPTLLIATLVLILLAPWALAQPLTGTAQVELDHVTNPAIIGAGVNFAFSDYEYINFRTLGEWTDIHSQQVPLPDDEAEWASFNRLMDFAGFQYVRFCVGMTQWEPVNDNDDPHSLNLESGFTFSPGFWEAHPEVDTSLRTYQETLYRLLDHWEQRGLYVVLGNWWSGPSNFCPGGDVWLQVKDADGKRIGATREDMHLASLEEFSEGLAAIMYDLKREHPYECVKGISFWNEPEQMKDYYATLSGVYNSLGAQLRRLGIRNEVAIQAFDGALFWNREHGGVPDGVERLGKLAKGNMDLLSVHDYWAAFDYRKGEHTDTIHGTLSEFVDSTIKPAIEQSKAASEDGEPLPVIAGEFGWFGLMGEGGDAAKADFLQRLHSAEATVHLLNGGAKAIAFWIYNNNYHSYWRMLTFDPDNYRHFVPEPANYYPLALTMKYLPRGADVVASEVTGATDEAGNQRVFLLAAHKGDEVTLLLVNDSDQPANLALSGLAGHSLRKLVVSQSDYSRIRDLGQQALADGAEIGLEPLSITVLTSFGYGAERPEGF